MRNAVITILDVHTLKFEPGETFKFDWSEESLLLGGVWRKLAGAQMKPAREPGFGAGRLRCRLGN